MSLHKPYWTNGRAVLWQGHVLDCLAAMEAGSVHCAVTSPPYWGLRDYSLPSLEWGPVSYAPMAGLPEIEIPGCAEGCEHVWGEERVVRAGRDPALQVKTSTLGIPKDGTRPRKCTAANQQYQAQATDITQGQYCQLCGGWRGCLGLEPTVEMFVGHIVLVARELWRVLRDDGTFWLNFGDSYTSGMFVHGYLRNVRRGSQWHTFGDYRTDGGAGKRDIGNVETAGRAEAKGLKPKDLIGIPWRVAFALQADGWYLRSDIIWAKGVSFCPTYSGSCMPESVRDRPTTGHEHVFLLAKGKRYFYDATAVRENVGQPTRQSATFRHGDSYTQGQSRDNGAGYTCTDSTEGTPSFAGRNLRTVWTINPGSYAGAHFATFPPALVEPMIKAGTSAKGCCSSCGAPFERVTEKGEFKTLRGGEPFCAEYGQKMHGMTDLSGVGMTSADGFGSYERTTTGWTPTCSCDAGEPVPCTVLDPFAGTFTTGEVAIRLGRRAVGIELSKDYCDEHIIPRLDKDLQMELTI